MDEESAKIPEAAETQATQVEAEAKTEVGDASTDYEAIMAEKDAKIEQLQKVVADKDKAIKKYKPVALGKKAADDWSDDEDDITPSGLTREEAEAIFDQKLAQSQLAKVVQEKEEIVQRLARENKELRLAAQNQPTSVAQGAGQDTSKASDPKETIPPDIKAKYTAEMEREGKTPEQIEDFFKKVRANMK